MLSKAQAEALQKLQPLVGNEGVINIALILCGARNAYAYDNYRNTIDADVKDYEATVDRHCQEVAVAVAASFKKVKVLSANPLIFHDPERTDEDDARIVKKGNYRTLKTCRALGRLLGFAGTAFPGSKHPNSLGVDLICVDTKGRYHSVTQYNAFPSELHAALEAFKDFESKARKLVGIKLSADFAVKAFLLRCDRGRFEISFRNIQHGLELS